jgi:hypothetical protein
VTVCARFTFFVPSFPDDFSRAKCLFEKIITVFETKKKKMRLMGFVGLPVDLIRVIAMMCPLKDRVKLRAVCQQLKEYLDEDDIWLEAIQREFPHLMPSVVSGQAFQIYMRYSRSAMFVRQGKYTEELVFPFPEGQRVFNAALCGNRLLVATDKSLRILERDDSQSLAFKDTPYDRALGGSAPGIFDLCIFPTDTRKLCAYVSSGNICQVYSFEDEAPAVLANWTLGNSGQLYGVHGNADHIFATGNSKSLYMVDLRTQASLGTISLTGDGRSFACDGDRMYVGHTVGIDLVDRRVSKSSNLRVDDLPTSRVWRLHLDLDANELIFASFSQGVGVCFFWGGSVICFGPSSYSSCVWV